MKKTGKTNAARLLDGLHIEYALQEYAVDDVHLEAEAVAEKIGMPPLQVFKTLVTRGDKTGVLMACIPGNHEVNLKALAAVSHNKKVEMVPLKEVTALTGYVRGGVSPLGAKKKYPVYIDDSCRQWDVIAVSAGIRGCQLVVAPSDLITAAAAITANISHSK